MADFSDNAAKREAGREATNFLPLFRAIYEQAKLIQSVRARYQAAEQPLVGVLNAFYTGPQLTELGQMAAALNSLVTDWEANHTGVLSGG